MESPVWLIDDNENALEIMKILLEKNGYITFIYNSPFKALHDLEQGQIPKLIVTDYNMPGMLGTEFIEIVRTIVPDVPSIIITGNSNHLSNGTDLSVIEKGNVNFMKDLLWQINKAIGSLKKNNLNSRKNNPKISTSATSLLKRKTFKNAENFLQYSDELKYQQKNK